MTNCFKKSIAPAFAIVSGFFTFVPEAFFEKHKWITDDVIEQCKWLADFDPKDVNATISRVAFLLFVWLATFLVYCVSLRLRRWITIKGRNYTIRVEYGDILKKRKCKRVISFDECYTTQVGDKTADIKRGSICGQYLALHPDIDVQRLSTEAHIAPASSASQYQQKTRYDPGTIIPNGDDLLMAFAKLDEKGKGRFFSRDEYLMCLDLLWKELEGYSSEKDICVPILGAGTTTFEDGSGASISQQDLLDILILSYKLSSHKIKNPRKLRIVCRKNKGFSLNKIAA